jgi:group II intron reverse transcriptase/maturase
MSDVTPTKPYSIAKRTVWDAYQQVKANRGAAGIDDETIAIFEQNLSKNLYKLWNRMSSGSYIPPLVRQVKIPKASGGFRKLGIPTVSDRVAQTVAKLLIEPILDPMFHPDSYGYRPGKSAKQAVAITRERCWKHDWVVEFDIEAAFDQIDHMLLMKAVRKHIKEDWILLYIERWLTAPFETAEGISVPRERGTPQDGVVSPILMNLFMHYAFDHWMKRTYPQCPFARYADDAVVHCHSQKQAEDVMQSIASRLAECGLTMHSEKSKIVYCRKSNRQRHTLLRCVVGRFAFVHLLNTYLTPLTAPFPQSLTTTPFGRRSTGRFETSSCKPISGGLLPSSVQHRKLSFAFVTHTCRRVRTLSIYSQDELDAIALSLNTRPRARLRYESPLVVYTQHIALLQHPTDTLINPVLRLEFETAGFKGLRLYVFKLLSAGF